jgi:hypothetical protein
MKTTRKTIHQKVSKPMQERIADCETHLFFLHEALNLFQQQYDRYKQIAAELRVLVCKTRQNKPLLLDLMDELGFTYDVHPPGPPGPLTIPIPLVGWRDDPDFQAHTQEVQQAADDEQKLATIQKNITRKPMPLRDYTDKALAIFIRPFDYSYRDLILSVAQQCGSSHEDKAIDEPIAQMRSLVIDGIESHIAPLIDYARRVVDAGANFILYSVEKGLYRARYFAKKTA